MHERRTLNGRNLAATSFLTYSGKARLPGRLITTSLCARTESLLVYISWSLSADAWMSSSRVAATAASSSAAAATAVVVIVSRNTESGDVGTDAAGACGDEERGQRV